MAQIRQLSNRFGKAILFVALFGLVASCLTDQQHEVKSKDIFCDSCEYAVMQAVFKYDSIAVFFKDYTDLENIHDSFQPINGNYIPQIDTSKYLNDSSITNYIPALVIKEYINNISMNPELPIKQYGELKLAILKKEKIDSVVKTSKRWSFMEFSKPLFSNNNQYALVEVNYNCFGLCGDGYTYIVKKENNHWLIYKKIFRWVS